MNPATLDLEELVDLSLTLGLPQHDFVILAEGNTSAQTREGHFAVKASGAQMALAKVDDFVELEWEPLVQALRNDTIGNTEVNELFRRASPGNGPARAPSTETFIHAVGYGLCGATFVAHTHPTAITAMLSSTIADADLRRALFPDEAVVGGVQPAIVGYADPGIELGRLVLREVLRYQDDLGRNPRVVLLKNHGVVTFGRSAAEVEAATFMATKAARVRLAAAAAGGLSPLPEGAAEHVAGRSDEEARLTSLFGDRGGDSER